MKQLILSYKITRAPKAVRRARFDNIALVPASLLPKKGKYQTIANNLPGQGVLLCQIDNTERITHILEHVARYFRQKGHVVKTLPYSVV
jgi:hypothetical protein